MPRMKFSEVAAQTLAWLQRDERVSYPALKREFDLDDEFLEDLKAELIDAKRLAMDEDGKVLVWVGVPPVLSSESRVLSSKDEDRNPVVSNASPLFQDSALRTQHSSAERRQLTVLFCDLVGSTALSTRLDPEELRDLIRAYQQTCAEVIHRHDGYIAQYLGDGLLVYFGYPTAHEDDARRAVRAGLEIVAALPRLNEQASATLVGARRRRAPTDPATTPLLQVRLGIHTGLVVVGAMGASGRTEQLALGETPNVAARVQGLAEPNTVLISAATQRLIEGQFECQPFGAHFVKGLDTPIAVYHVQGERQGATPFARKTLLTPLVGRDQEVGLLLDRWEQVKEGRGQVVLLSGEPGIGKSRLAYTLQEHVTAEGSLLFEARCSPYYQQSALYPLLEVVQRTLLWTRQENNEEKIAKLERALALSDMQASLSLFTALLSLPTPAQYPPLNLTPQKQKERTLQAVVQLFIAQAERQATVSVWEDLHWADPSSLEFLSLLIEQLPTTKLLLVLTFRPEFMPPWKLRSHCTQLTLNRLGHQQVETMIEQVAAGKPLPVEVLEQIRAKTDGVPLFVEELTKSVMESVGATHASPLHLAIPATLQEALMARLDRLADARPIAQLGATLGREFSYELLHAVAPTSETGLQATLAKLVEAEILYQRGIGEQARYFFKHALIQDTAYQSLLKSTRQQYHQQIAHVLEDRFPDTKEHQPELVAHHYTEAGLIEQAIPYWQQAGQQAVQHSANMEAISHLTKGLELLKALPDTLERTQQELTLQLTLTNPLTVLEGYSAPEVERTCNRALELCRQLGETPHLFWVLLVLSSIRFVRAEHQIARELAEQCLQLAQSAHNATFLVWGHYMMGMVLYCLGEFVLAQEHLEQCIVLYDPQTDSPIVSSVTQDPKVTGLSYAAWTLWHLGYPDQARERMHEALALAQELAHPFSLAFALDFAATLSQYRREWYAAQEQTEAVLVLAREQGFANWLARGNIKWGWLLAEQGQGSEGSAQIRQGLANARAIGSEHFRPYSLTLLAEAYEKVGQTEEGLSVLAEAFTVAEKTGECFYEAELYRLKGELLLAQEGKK